MIFVAYVLDYVVATPLPADCEGVLAAGGKAYPVDVINACVKSKEVADFYRIKRTLTSAWFSIVFTRVLFLVKLNTDVSFQNVFD